jgi:hypothetical protein
MAVALWTTDSGGSDAAMDAYVWAPHRLAHLVAGPDECYASKSKQKQQARRVLASASVRYPAASTSCAPTIIAAGSGTFRSSCQPQMLNCEDRLARGDLSSLPNIASLDLRSLARTFVMFLNRKWLFNSGIIGCILGLSMSTTVDGNAQEMRPPPPPKYKVDRKGGGGLWTTGSTVRVFGAPKAGARLLTSYPAGAIMVLYGTATGTPYVWVSPCNACEKGYALKSEFFRGSKE